MPWLKLIRWKNLLIIFLTQFLAWRCVITPQILGFNGKLAFFFSTVNFLCLSASTVLIAAAGYIINDYFDIKIDTINRPEKVVLGKAIPRRKAILLHTLLNVIALLLAGYVAAQTRHFEWLLLQVGCTVLLWFYSTHFKRQYMTGNIVVALLTALTILILVVYNPGIYKITITQSLAVNGSPFLPVWTLIVYAFFAFMLTWMREIVKDMEDFQGDEAEGCVTMPIKKGLQYSVTFIRVLSSLVVISLAAACYLLFLFHYRLFAGYLLALLIIPVIIWAIYLNRQHTAQHYYECSKRLKIIMVLGVLSLVVYYIQLFLSNAVN
jgi:4-hydroxybenzoate polyprenyltransferase